MPPSSPPKRFGDSYSWVFLWRYGFSLRVCIELNLTRMCQPPCRSASSGGGGVSISDGFLSRCVLSVVRRSARNVWSRKLASASGPSDFAANTQCLAYAPESGTPPAAAPAGVPYPFLAEPSQDARHAPALGTLGTLGTPPASRPFHPFAVPLGVRGVARSDAQDGFFSIRASSFSVVFVVFVRHRPELELRLSRRQRRELLARYLEVRRHQAARAVRLARIVPGLQGFHR